MARDLALRNLADGTRQQYLRCCCELVRYHMKSPVELDEADIKEFLHRLLELGAGPETLKMHVAGVKFLFGVTLNRPEVAERIPWPKVPRRKPDILSGTEVEKVLRAVLGLAPAAVLTVAYGAGLRISEACRLRIEDLDAKRGLIHVRLGKGKKDRYVMLSTRLLEALRRYWVAAKPDGRWLFPGRTTGHITASGVRLALHVAVKKVKLKKRVTPHTLRHSFATHLLELGTDSRIIQALLGHASMRTTMGYTQVSAALVGRVTSPLDVLGTPQGAVLR
jgi:site-specific recombinase XerD